MAVQVRLDLSDSVSVRDLRTFLSFIPQHFDTRYDLRWGLREEDKVVYLAACFPSGDAPEGDPAPHEVDVP